eukprot:1160932-Pelagomonas_calceolata.AAC.9
MALLLSLSCFRKYTDGLQLQLRHERFVSLACSPPFPCEGHEVAVSRRTNMPKTAPSASFRSD